MADKVGVFNRLQYSVSGGTTGTTEFEFLEGSSIGLTEQVWDPNGLRGTRAHVTERTRTGTRQVGGTINMAPTPVELAVLLPLILGGTPSGTSYPLGESLTLFNLFPIRDGAVYTASDLAVESATFSCQESGPMQLSMTVVGKDEVLTGSAGSLSPDVTTGPFVLADSTGAVSVGGSARQVSGFELTIQNVLEVKYRNSLTPTQIVATDRIITLNLPISLGTDVALYSSTSVAASITLTNGAVSLVLSMAAVRAPRQPLPFGQRGILDFPWRGVARKTGSTLELVTTLDSTP